MPIQTFAISTATNAQPGEVRKPIGWLMKWMSPRTSLIAPASVWNRNRKMKPVISSGSSQGMMISDRARRWSGNRRLNSSARLKPMMNWKSSERPVKMNVRAMALCVTDWVSVSR